MVPSPRVPLEHGFIRPFDGHRAAQAFDQVLGDPHHLTTVVHAISEQSANDEDRLTDLLLRREPDVAEGSRHPPQSVTAGPMWAHTARVPRFRNDDGRLGPATERHGGSIGFGIEEEEPVADAGTACGDQLDGGLLGDHSAKRATLGASLP